MSNEFWVINNYDSLVKESGTDGLTFEHSRKLLAEKWAVEVEAGILLPERPDLVTEGLHIVERYLKPLRAVRRNKMRNIVERIVLSESVDNDTLQVFLKDSFPLGTQDGRDKALWFWGREDFTTSVKMRYRKAVESAEAAKQFDMNAADPAIALMVIKGVQYFGECFNLPQESSS